MPKPTKGARLGSGPAHQKLLLGGLAAALLREERIRTTEAKAKRVRPVAEKLITLGKAGTVHARRQALSVIEDRDIVHKLFDDVAPRFADRSGGYTRIVKLGPRQGDAAPMAIIELVEGEAPERTAGSDEEPKRRRGVLRGRRSRKQHQDSPAEPAARKASRAGQEEATEADEIEQVEAEAQVPPTQDEKPQLTEGEASASVPQVGKDAGPGKSA